MAEPKDNGHSETAADDRASSPDPTNVAAPLTGPRQRSAVQRLRRLLAMGPLEVSSFQQLTESRPPIQHQGGR